MAPLFSIRSLIYGSAILALSAAALYLGAPVDLKSQAKEYVTDRALSDGLTSNLVPWQTRAEPVIKSFLTNNLDQLARASLAILHPGSDQNEMMYEIRPEQDHMLVQFELKWRGPDAQTNDTVLVWELNEKQHVAIKLLTDSGAQPDALVREQLTDYYRLKVYPGLREAMERARQG